MADNLSDYPIVQLEYSSALEIGKVGLFDLLMPVGSTGLVFTAAVPGRLYQWGPNFSDEVQRIANLRAATTLIQMGLIRGESLAFIRSALRMTQLEMATIYGVTPETVLGWETNTIPIPRNVWTCLSYRACLADGPILPADQALAPSWRPRLIRVFPNVPMVSTADAVTQPVCPQPPNFRGSSCYPPSNC